jgi:hypothetical protein
MYNMYFFEKPVTYNLIIINFQNLLLKGSILSPLSKPINVGGGGGSSSSSSSSSSSIKILLII